MKALPCKLVPGEGFQSCDIEESTHIRINIRNPFGCLHLPVIRSGTREGTGCWTWNGDLDKPTLKPSIKTEGMIGENSCHEDGGPSRKCICHTWVTDGKAFYHDDTTHELKGQTVDLLDV